MTANKRAELIREACLRAAMTDQAARRAALPNWPGGDMMTAPAYLAACTVQGSHVTEHFESLVLLHWGKLTARKWWQL